MTDIDFDFDFDFGFSEDVEIQKLTDAMDNIARGNHYAMYRAQLMGLEETGKVSIVGDLDTLEIRTSGTKHGYPRRMSLLV